MGGYGTILHTTNGGVTFVEGAVDELPTEFSLAQNYPNPFTPTTSIKFKVPSSKVVTLKVFDVLGREVATLVNEVKEPGTYTVQWDARLRSSAFVRGTSADWSNSGGQASGVSSGVYFYRLQARPLSGGQAGAFSATRELLLLR